MPTVSFSDLLDFAHYAYSLFLKDLLDFAHYA